MGQYTNRYETVNSLSDIKVKRKTHDYLSLQKFKNASEHHTT